MVGYFRDSFESVPPLFSLKEWAFERWSPKRGLKISRLGRALVLFKFENKYEVDSVLLRGSRRFKEREFLLLNGDLKWGVFGAGAMPRKFG